MNAGGMAFLHGWGAHPVIWEPLLEFFPGAHALPMPGYDGSDAAFTLDEIAAKLSAQLEDETLLIGWSLGGQVAVRIALDYPEKVSRLCLIAATPCFVNRVDWSHGVDAEVFNQILAIHQHARMHIVRQRKDMPAARPHLEAALHDAVI